MISTGKGFKVSIKCEYVAKHDWMVFAAWYSLNKLLPDAEVEICCKRSPIRQQMFYWTHRCKVPFKFTEQTTGFVIQPNTMAVDEFLENLGPVDVKSDETATFVWYDESKYQQAPFGMAKDLLTKNISVNEYRMLKLWEKCYDMYVALAER